MDKSIADLVELIISDWKKFASFCALVASLVGLSLLLVWLVPKLLHLSASRMTISTKGSEIELMSSNQDQDQYYLIVSPQASWQPTHIYIRKGTKITIAADGRVNVDLHGIWERVERRIRLEEAMERLHPSLRKDLNHTPEEYFSFEDWQSLAPRHYWTGPEGEPTDVPTSFAGRKKYKIAPDLAYGALLGTIMTREDVDSNGEPPTERHEVFAVGRRWPDPRTEEGVPSSGWLWLAINDVVEPESAFPKAKDIRVSDVFLLDNLGFYRAVVTVPH